MSTALILIHVAVAFSISLLQTWLNGIIIDIIYTLVTYCIGVMTQTSGMRHFCVVRAQMSHLRHAPSHSLTSRIFLSSLS